MFNCNSILKSVSSQTSLQARYMAKESSLNIQYNKVILPKREFKLIRLTDIHSGCDSKVKTKVLNDVNR